MKNIFTGVLLAVSLVFCAFPVYGSDIQIKVDGKVIPSDVSPEIRNNRTMVPLRVISEILGANIQWDNSEAILTKGDMKVLLRLNNATADKKGDKIQLDVKPYLKNNRVLVPLRFIAEAFQASVNYSNLTVSIDTPPLFIEGEQVKSLQYEYRMTMGGTVYQINGNSYIEEIYNIFLSNKVEKVNTPANYSWMVNTETPGSYYKNGQFDFLDQKGDSLARFDLYSLNQFFPAELLDGYPVRLIHDFSNDQWYLFNKTTPKTIDELIHNALMNGFVKVIKDTNAIPNETKGS